jgi:hypothetical protein
MNCSNVAVEEVLEVPRESFVEKEQAKLESGD